MNTSNGGADLRSRTGRAAESLCTPRLGCWPTAAAAVGAAARAYLLGVVGLRGRDVPVAGDNTWQRKARGLQSDWREAHGLAAGTDDRGEPLASRLTLADGQPPRLANYLSSAAKAQVLTAVASAAGTGAVLVQPRLWVDLLSSQPLCFNAFGELAADLALATRVLGRLWPELVWKVEEVRFEYSPGRGDPTYTGNRSAFDVWIVATGPRGRGFLGIEVKYHEDMRVKAARDRDYAGMARTTGVFHAGRLAELAGPPFQQLLLDHLLALRMQAAHPLRWDWCRSVLLFPSGNARCEHVASDYLAALSDDSTWSAPRLEQFLDAAAAVGAGTWVDEVRHRYVGHA